MGLRSGTTVRDVRDRKRVVEGRNRGGPGSVQCAMTILDTLPPMRAHGALEISHDPLADVGLYRQLLLQAPSTGRCPILLSDHALGSLPEDRKAAPASAELEQRDVAAVFADRYPDGCLYHSDCLAPFGKTFPGLAPPTPTRALLRAEEIVETAVEEADALSGALLGLVPADRPADVPAATGWFGMCNSWDDVVAMSAVLRSWEDRFGAVLVLMGRATLQLAVAGAPVGAVRVPRGRRGALRVLRRHVPRQPRHDAGLREPAARIRAVELLVGLTPAAARFCRCPSLGSPRARSHGP